MEVEIFDQDMEFFELKTQVPKNEEQIVVLLRIGVDDGNYLPWTSGSGYVSIQTTDQITLDYATYYN